MSESCSDIKWLRTLLVELSFGLNLPTTLFCDNTVSNLWSEGLDSVQRTKHVNRKYYFVKESVTNRRVHTKDINFEDNLLTALQIL